MMRDSNTSAFFNECRSEACAARVAAQAPLQAQCSMLKWQAYTLGMICLPEMRMQDMEIVARDELS